MSDGEREDRFMVHEDDIQVVSRSGSNLIVSIDVMERAKARVAAGEDPEVVAFDVATEDVYLRSRIDNPRS